MNSFSLMLLALNCCRVEAALQQKLRESTIRDQLKAKAADADIGKTITLPQEPTGSGADKSCPNMGPQFIELGACGAGLEGSKKGGAPPGSMYIPATEALPARTREEDIAEQISAGDKQRDLGIYAAAENHYNKARELAKDLDDRSHLTEVSQQIAALRLLQGKPTDALHELATIPAASWTATVLHLLGNAHREMGNLTKALELYEEATALQDEFPELMIDIGETHARLGSLDEASRHVRNALESLKSFGAYLKRGTPRSLDAARAHSLDGFIHLSHGDASRAFERFNVALSILEGAVKVETVHAGHPELVSTLLLMTRALRDLGSIEPALEGVESLEQTLRELQSEELHLSRVLTQKADILRELKRLPAADEAMKEALELQAKIFGNESLPEIASALNIYGSILHDQGNLSSALVRYQQALAMNLDTVGQWHPETAAVHNSLGTLFQDQGDLKSAGIHFDACLEVQLKALGEHRPEVASTYNNMATIAFQEGRAKEAEAHLERALSILDAAGVAEESPDRAAYFENLEYVTSQLYDDSV